MSEQQAVIPSSPVAGRPLALTSATVTVDGTRSLDPGPLRDLELSVSVRVLGDFDIDLATTEDVADSAEEMPTAGRRELRTNPVLLSVLPDVIHLAGRSHGPHHDDDATRSYTLTLAFSDGTATAQLWSTTFEVPRTPVAGPTWHLSVPFSHLPEEVPGETT